MTGETLDVELDVSWKHVRSVWWLIFWRGNVVFNLPFFFGGLILGESGPYIPPYIIFIWAILVFVWVVQSALRKSYKTFEIHLVKIMTEEEVEVNWENIRTVCWSMLSAMVAVYFITFGILWLIHGDIIPGISLGYFPTQIGVAIGLIWAVRWALKKPYSKTTHALSPLQRH